MAKITLSIPFHGEVERYAARLLKTLKPRSIVLYGSMAKGEHGVGSDIDLLVVAEHLPANFLERLKLLNILNRSTAPIEALAYTPSEFKHMLRKKHPTALFALDEGVIIYDDGYIKKMKSEFLRLKREHGLIKVKDGWETKPTKQSEETPRREKNVTKGDYMKD